MSSVPSSSPVNIHFPATFPPVAGASVDSTTCLLVNDLAKLFFAHGLRGLAPSTCNTYHLYLRYFCEKFGHVPITKVVLFDVFAWIGSKPGWKSPSTFATVDKCLKRLFNWGVRFGLIDRNPVAGLPVPREAQRRNWKNREFIRVVRSTTPALKRVLYFMCWTGARPGEVSNVRWSDVDWERSCIVLHHHKTATTLRTPKPRTLILVPLVVRLLKWMKAHRPYSANIFVNDHEQPWTATNLCRRLERIRNKLRLPKDVKIYGVRHLYGTDAIRRGTDIKTLSLLMGHASVRMTERYIHLSEDTSYLIEAAKRATGKDR